MRPLVIYVINFETSAESTEKNDKQLMSFVLIKSGNTCLSSHKMRKIIRFLEN